VPGFNPCAYQVKTRFQAFAFHKTQLAPLHNDNTAQLRLRKPTGDACALTYHRRVTRARSVVEARAACDAEREAPFDGRGLSLARNRPRVYAASSQLL
jgi:hypothetical protein